MTGNRHITCKTFLVMITLSFFAYANDYTAQNSYHSDYRNQLLKMEFVPPSAQKTSDNLSPEAQAFAWLKANHEKYGLPADLANVELAYSRESLLGTHLHFQQTLLNRKVLGAEITISVARDTGQVYLVYNNTYPDNSAGKRAHSGAIALDEDTAYDIAWNRLRVHGELSLPPAAELVWLPGNGQFRLVYRVDLSVEAPFGHWQQDIDAQSGEVVALRSRAISNHPLHVDIDKYDGPVLPRSAAFARFYQKSASDSRSKAAAKATVDGSGKVFETDPRTALQDASLQDNSPASAFTAAYVTKPLRDISENNGVYTLEGPWVRIINFESPNTAPSTTNNGNWTANRGNNAFNDAMVYFQIDQNQRYIQSMGFSNVQQVSIEVDSDGVNGQDNSYFIPGANRIAFGHGCVDDSEESFTILHEYGHAVHTAIAPGWSGGDTGAMGEGFGDYWAGSHRYASPNGNTFNTGWAFPWVGHNSCWQGRNMDNTSAQYNPNASYPAHEVVGGVDGDELWATPLYQAHITLRGQGVPRGEIDRIVLQAIYGTGANISMREMANNIVNVAQQLYPNGPHATVFTQKFQAQNILDGSGGGGGGGGGGTGGGGGSSSTELSNGVAVSLSGAAESETLYHIDVPADTTNLTFATTGGSGDLDLYVKFGSAPTQSSYDHRPYESGNSETVTITSPQAGTYHVMIHGYAAYSGATLTANFDTSGGGGGGGGGGGTGGGGGSSSTELSNGVGVSLSGAAASETPYHIEVPADATNLTFETNGGSGDLDLYVKFDSAPTQNSYDHRPYENGNSETVTIASPQAGTYHVMIHGYAAYSGATLTVSFDTTGGGGTGGGGGGGGTGGGGGSSSTALSNGVAVSSSGAAESETHYHIDVPAGATNLTFTTNGGSGDLDLYVKFGAAPTQNSYDHRPYENGNNEQVDIASPQAGTYHVMIYGYAAYNGATLTVSYDTSGGGGTGGGGTGGGGTGGGSQSQTFNGSVSEGAYQTYALEATGGQIQLELNWSGSADLDLVLFDPDGNEVEVSFFDQPETITHSVTTAGTYTVEVSNYYGNNTSYTLSAQWQ